ncbi:Nuclear envelope morphology protein 1 [Tulasnella sp. 425]|nr:Nuclear envelope morphology protein 1 [Tulasnella sp. 425]
MSNSANEPAVSLHDMERLMDIREALNIVQQSDSNHEEREQFLRKLPKLHERDIGDKGQTNDLPFKESNPSVYLRLPDDTCPICQETFLSVLALEEMATAMDTPGMPEEQLGVTKLDCGHLFCRKDLSVWLALNNTCPSCRANLPLPAPPAVNTNTLPDDFLDVLRQVALIAGAGSTSMNTNEQGEILVEAPNGTILMASQPPFEYDEDRSKTPSPSRRQTPSFAPFVALWAWICVNWRLFVFLRKTVLGTDMGVEETDEDEEVDDPLVTRAPSKGKAKDVGADDETETDTAGMADDDVAFSSSSLRSRPRQRVRPSSWPSSPVIASASDTITIGNSPPVISLNTEFPDESTSLAAASSSTSTTTYLLQAGPVDPTVELTPPTPAPHSTPLPLPQTLLLNPYAGSLLTTHHPKSSKRRSLPAGSSPRTLTPTPTTRTRTPLHLPKTLVLDLDETLIHSTARAPNNSYGQGLFSAGGLGFGSGNGGVGFGIWGGKKMGPGHMVEVVLGGRSTLYHVYKRPFVDYFLKKVWWHIYA